MGHEIAGEVVEVGADAQGGFQVGDRVQCIAAVPCGECHVTGCQKGWMEVCQNQTSVGYQYDGGFAEYMIVPEQVLKVDGLNRIPDNVGYDEASAAEPFACAINARSSSGSRRATSPSSSAPARSGACTSASRAVSQGRPGRPRRRQRRAPQDVGRRRGSRPRHQRVRVDVVEEVMRLTGGRGADVIITATPASITRSRRSRWPRVRGRISFFGGLPKNDPFISATQPGPYRQLHIHGANGSSPDHNKRALGYISTGQVPVRTSSPRRSRSGT